MSHRSPSRISAARSHCVKRTIRIALSCMLGIPSLVSAATLCVNTGGTLGCHSTISSAVSAASAGDLIKVWPGIYKEDVVITKTLSLIAATPQAPVIDATGLANGIFINGMSAAPDIGITNVLVAGFKIRNANFEGILIANAYGATIIDNQVSGNDKSLDIANASCPGIPAFETNEGEDCGEGIHLIATHHNTIARNQVFGNSGGILISDETGQNRENYISKNFVHDNPFDCGITMASHPPATSVIPSATVSYGVVRNNIRENWSWHNGTQLPGAGAGVGIFAPGPGATADGNVVVNNDIRNNGQPGVTMHNHAAGPPSAPPVDFNNNVIVGNYIAGNAADAEDAHTAGPTGINIFSLVPVLGTIIAENDIDHEAFDIVFNAPSGELMVHLNDFSPGVGIDNAGMGTVDATENWWGCPGGPGAMKCATVQGSNVVAAPWSIFPSGTD